MASWPLRLYCRLENRTVLRRADNSQTSDTQKTVSDMQLARIASSMKGLRGPSTDVAASPAPPLSKYSSHHTCRNL